MLRLRSSNCRAVAAPRLAHPGVNAEFVGQAHRLPGNRSGCPTIVVITFASGEGRDGAEWQ